MRFRNDKTRHSSTRAAPGRAGLARGAVLFGALVGGVLLAELGLRAMGLPRARFDFIEGDLGSFCRPDPDVFWRLDPENDLFVTNRLGLRGYAPGEEKAAEDLRIVCVGASCTFGAGVGYDDAYGVQLERALQRAHPGRRVDVVLGGLGAYSTYQDRVLFERDLAPLQPDLCLFYCGLYNDWAPAVGRTDAERGERGALGSLRLAEIFVVRAESEAHRDSALEELGAGGVPAPRVPLDEYRANLAAMIARARELGSEVILVLPLPSQRMQELHPQSEVYLEATRVLGEELEVAMVDVGRVIREYESRVDPEWFDEVWPAFIDNGHPSVFGHELIADALFEPVCEKLGLERAGIAQAAPERDLRIDRDIVHALEQARIVVSGAGLEGVDRAWVGDTWIPDVKSLGVDRVQLTLPPDVVPGRHAILLRTKRGLVRVATSLSVQGPPWDVKLEPGAEGWALTASGEAPEGWQVLVWVSGERRPRETRWGTFELELGVDGRPPGDTRTPFRFEHLPAALASAVARPDGEWAASTVIDDPNRGVPATLYAQALLVDERRHWAGVLSDVVVIGTDPRHESTDSLTRSE